MTREAPEVEPPTGRLEPVAGAGGPAGAGAGAPLERDAATRAGELAVVVPARPAAVAARPLAELDPVEMSAGLVGVRSAPVLAPAGNDDVSAAGVVMKAGITESTELGVGLAAACGDCVARPMPTTTSAHAATASAAPAPDATRPTLM
jgi:hypothetical protein